MPGAGGVRAANYLYNVAPKDGTVIAMLDQAVYLDHVLETPGLAADPAKFNWIGRLLGNSAVLYAWHAAPVQKIEDVFSRELIVATSGTASRLNWTVLNNVAGTKFKIITGYKGTTDSRLAMIRGELEASSQPWSVLKLEGEQLLKEKRINLLLQSGAQNNADLPDVPRMIDLAKNDDDRTLLALFSSPSTIGRSVAAPPASRRSGFSVSTSLHEGNAGSRSAGRSSEAEARARPARRRGAASQHRERIGLVRIDRARATSGRVSMTCRR